MPPLDGGPERHPDPAQPRQLDEELAKTCHQDADRERHDGGGEPRREAHHRRDHREIEDRAPDRGGAEAHARAPAPTRAGARSPRHTRWGNSAWGSAIAKPRSSGSARQPGAITVTTAGATSAPS